jgi:hypothetical protein
MFPEVGDSCTPTFFERKGLMEIAATVDTGAIRGPERKRSKGIINHHQQNKSNVS